MRGADRLSVLEAVCDVSAPARRAAAREALCRAVSTREEAVAARPSADGFYLWSALVEGRWTLLDAFTAAGVRYVVAHENPTAAGTARALTLRERLVLSQVLAGVSGKCIALEMQISQSTVSRVLRSALDRLGATDLCTLSGLRTARFEPLGGLGAGAVAFARIEGMACLLAELTAAERSVLGGVIAGQTMAGIARDRHSSPRTVAHQLESIYRKVGVTSRRELLAMFQ